MNQVEKYIAIPLAINVLRQDMEHFKDYSMAPVYTAKIKTVIKQLEDEFRNLKREFHMVRNLGSKDGAITYSTNEGILKFAPEELKHLTRKIMSEYISGDKAIEVEFEDGWGEI